MNFYRRLNSTLQISRPNSKPTRLTVASCMTFAIASIFMIGDVAQASYPIATTYPIATEAKESLEWTKDSVEVIRKNIEDGKAVFVDVRSSTETKKGYLKDARLLPVADLLKGSKEEAIRNAIKKGQIVYTYCVVGKRAIAGGEVIQKLGYDVRPLKLGFNELVEAGFEVQK